MARLKVDYFLSKTVLCREWTALERYGVLIRPLRRDLAYPRNLAASGVSEL
jgi:hypothetical protein